MPPNHRLIIAKRLPALGWACTAALCGIACTGGVPEESALSAQSGDASTAIAGSGGTPMAGGGGTLSAGGAPTAGAAGSGLSLIDDPTGPLPETLTEVGLYPTPTDLSVTHSRAFSYEPRHALWSNGLTKTRFFVLPDGTQVNTAIRDAWEFPVGTLFFKTFTFADAEQRIVPVETRLIRRVSDQGDVTEQWEFATYEWNAEGTGATLTNSRLRIEREAWIGGQSITHTIPKKGDCWNCHVANKSPIIGFDELRLNLVREGDASSQLESVMANGWLTAPPAPPWAEVVDADPVQQQVLGYLHGNCAHCHNGEPPLEPGARYPALDLRWDQVLSNTINIQTMSVATMSGPRITPGDPDGSVLFQAILLPTDAESEVKLMPPVGVDVRDEAAIEMIRGWIQTLTP